VTASASRFASATDPDGAEDSGCGNGFRRLEINICNLTRCIARRASLYFEVAEPRLDWCELPMQLNEWRAGNIVKTTTHHLAVTFSVWLLCGLILGAPAFGSELPDGNPAEQVAAIRARLEAARAEYIRKVEKASTTAERDQLAKEVPRSEPYANLMLRVAEQHPNDPAALDALLWVVGNSETRGSANVTARAILVENYADNDRLTPFAVALSWWANAADEDALRQLLARNSTNQVRAAATYALALQLIAQAEEIHQHQVRLETAPSEEAKRQIKESLDQDFDRATANRLRNRKSKTLTDEAEQLLGSIVSHQPYASSEWPHEGTTIPLGELANRNLNAVRNLLPGKLAPATEGMDITGRKVSLADYRGKVILLIFSGHWCAPCRALYPLENKLSRDYATRPFTILGVNSDKSSDVVKKVIETEKMTWPVIWEGGTQGPMAKKWSVRGWPLVVLIDHLGIIRYKFRGAPGPTILTPLVDRLVGDAETSGKGGRSDGIRP
jgi:thiol-disulfide isomerase/thioredoxin